MECPNCVKKVIRFFTDCVKRVITQVPWYHTIHSVLIPSVHQILMRVRLPGGR